MVLTKEQAIHEAQQQKKALQTIGLWRRVLFFITACLAVLAFYGIQTGSGWFVPGVIAAVLGSITLLLTFIVNLSIRNGHRNVEKILNSLK